VKETEDTIRRICARLLDTPPDSEIAAWYREGLKAAAAQLANEEKAWNKASQSDQHQNGVRQSYRSRETDSADGFAEGLKLFNPKKPDSEKKKD
jgi:hypothetical protein